MRYIKTFEENRSVEDEEKDVLDIVSSVGDVCKSYKFFKTKNTSRTIGNGYGMILYIDDPGFINTNSQMMTKNLARVIEEIIDAESRLSEIGFYTLMNFKDYGMTLGIYRKESFDKVKIKSLDRPITESIIDLVKRNPIDPDIIQMILDINNSESFKKNNIVISKYIPNVSSISDKAALKNVACFKATFPEDCKFLEYPLDDKRSNEIFIFVRKAKKNKYPRLLVPNQTERYLIGSNFYGHFMSLEGSTYEYTLERLLEYFNSLVDHKEKVEYEKKREMDFRNKAKNFEKKFDREYIINIFADIISLIPDTSVSYINLTWSLRSKIKSRASEACGGGLEYDIDDELSELLELITTAHNRLKDDGLSMSLQFKFENYINSSSYLYIYVRESDKKEIIPKAV